MKTRTPLMLVEIFVMLFVFILAAALCFGILARANEISRVSEARDNAVILAQNAAEYLAQSHGDIASVTKTVSEKANENGLEIRISENDAVNDLLGSADIEVFFEGSSVFSLEAFWQEVQK